MGMILMMITMVMIMLVIGTVSFVGGIFGSGGIPVVVMIIAIAVFGSVMKEIAKSRKGLNRDSRKDLDEIKQRMTQIEADIADIKEQIADFIISQV